MSPSRSTTRTRISLTTGSGGANAPFGLTGSVLLHAAIVAAALFTWEHRLDIVQESAPVIPVDLVTIAQKTNIAPTVQQTPKVPPVPQVPPQQFAPPPIPEERSEPAPQVQAPSEPVIKPPPPPAIPTPKPQAQPPARKKTFDIDSVAALLNKVAPVPQQQNGKADAHAHKGIGAQNAMTMDLVDALRNQIEQCWSPPVGAPTPGELVVKFDLFLNPDGSVAQPPQLDADSAAAVSRDSFTRAAAEAARRAIYTCAPYKLPADRYAQWREIDPMIFDPRQMMGQ